MPEPHVPPFHAFDRLRTAGAGFQESCILAALGELDIATQILGRSNNASAKELAKGLQLDLRALTILLDALAALGYFEKSNNAPSNDARYSVAENYIELLDSRHPATFIPMFRHQGNCVRSWVQLARIVTDGQPAERYGSILGAETDNVSFILAMNSIGRIFAGPMVEELTKHGVLHFPKTNIRFIDIGGASGTYTLAFLEALPQSTGAIFDLPVAIREARRRFAGTPFEGRIAFAEGDFYQDEFPAGFDFAWVSAIVHQFGRAESRDFYAKAYRALNPGGRIAVRDFVIEENRTSPAQGAMFAVNMLVQTKTGMVYTFDEIREDLSASGFGDVRMAVPADTMSAVVVAEKG